MAISLLTQTYRRGFTLPYFSAATQLPVHSNDNKPQVNHFATTGEKNERFPSTGGRATFISHTVGGLSPSPWAVA
jgi:hypothetical protein